MYFKPRIFISSMLKDKIELRENIYNILKSSGAEVILYEKNLTPSVSTHTYREDILESDFVIFIFDKEEGAITDLGLTGTQEEFNIAEMKGIPFHIYLEMDSSTDFIDEIKKKGYSYYLYKDIKDLVDRIKSSMFTISKEISLYKLNENNLSYNHLKKMAINKDYDFALEFIKRVNIFKKYFWLDDNSKLRSSAFLYLFEHMYEWYLLQNNYIFIDTKLTKLLGLCLVTHDEYYSKRNIEFVLTGQIFQKFKVDNNLEVKLYEDRQNNPNVPIDLKWYDNKIQEFLNHYEKFKSYLSDRKLYSDSMF